jgi:hypothetical protein
MTQSRLGTLYARQGRPDQGLTSDQGRRLDYVPRRACRGAQRSDPAASELSRQMAPALVKAGFTWHGRHGFAHPRDRYAQPSWFTSHPIAASNSTRDGSSTRTSCSPAKKVVMRMLVSGVRRRPDADQTYSRSPSASVQSSGELLPRAHGSTARARCPDLAPLRAHQSSSCHRECAPSPLASCGRGSS